jgi:hypothetical protein
MILVIPLGKHGQAAIPGLSLLPGSSSVDPVTHSLSYGSAGLGILTLSLRKAAKVVVGDFDGDTRDELLVVRTDTNTARLFGWDGTKAVAELTETNSLLADLREFASKEGSLLAMRYLSRTFFSRFIISSGLMLRRS